MTEPAALTVDIARLGGRGDGLTGDGLIVPGALPGERVSVLAERGRARMLAVETASPDRVAPFCPYEARCGGCSLQHLAAPAYAEWKRGIVVHALEQAGLDAPVAPLVEAHGAGRRRIVLHVRSVEGTARAGLMAARSHDLVAIDHCPITVPALHRAPAIAEALAGLLGHGEKPLDVQVTAGAAGLDVDLRGHGPVSERVRARLSDLAATLDLARLSLHGDVVVERRPVALASGRSLLRPAPGGFLQATAAGEAALAGLVAGAMDRRIKRVADLFSGCGPFTLALAETRDVQAFESDAAALDALLRAARSRPDLHTVTGERRDLFRRPLLPLELDRFDAVVFDPPRAGAQAQAGWLAQARVPLVVGVSCDPGTFARDAASLIAGGYALEGVTPVDQFRYTGHVELVGVFRRPAMRGRPRR